MIIKIVITGGPSSGKTTVLSALKRVGGYSVFEEVARSLIESGWTPSDSRFQYEVLSNQISQEDALAASLSDEGVHIILLDRGAFDGSAYMSPGAWFDMLDSMDISEEQLKDRYDGVIYLASDRGHYVKDDVREEDFETAFELGNRVLEKYSQYFNVRCIEPTETIKEKIAMVRKEIDDIVQVRSS